MRKIGLVSILVLFLCTGMSSSVMILGDLFENGDLATGGTNGGFTYVDNVGGGAGGTASETGGQAVVSLQSLVTNPNGGIVSNNAFDLRNRVVHVTWEVASVSRAPAYNGLMLLLQQDSGLYSAAGPYIGLIIDGKVGNGIEVLLGYSTDGENIIALSTITNYQSSSLLDGFTASYMVSPVAWSIEITGLNAPNGIPITISETGPMGADI